MATILNNRFYKQVPAENYEEDILAIDEGQDLYIDNVGGNGCMLHSVKIEILFGDEIIFSTHGDAIQKVDKHYIGDGIKTLKILLTNSSLVSETIGAFYTGDLT